MRVPKATPGSWEAILHAIDPPDKIVLVNKLKENEYLNKRLWHRAIGVVYDPGSEQGNYVPSVLPERNDAFQFIDQTNALNPLPGVMTGDRNGAKIRK